MKQTKFEIAKIEAQKKILSKLFDTINYPPTRGAEVLREILLNGKNYKETADLLQLTSFRVKQIFELTTNRITHKINSVMEYLSKIEETEKEMKSIREENAAMKAKLDRYDERKKNLAALPPSIRKLLAQKITDASFSPRIKNLLINSNGQFFDKYFQMQTIEDLVQLSRQDFLKLRNAGAKSANEVEVFLNSKGLTWSMKI